MQRRDFLKNSAVLSTVAAVMGASNLNANENKANFANWINVFRVIVA